MRVFNVTINGPSDAKHVEDAMVVHHGWSWPQLVLDSSPVVLMSFSLSLPSIRFSCQVPFLHLLLTTSEQEVGLEVVFFSFDQLVLLFSLINTLVLSEADACVSWLTRHWMNESGKTDQQ